MPEQHSAFLETLPFFPLLWMRHNSATIDSPEADFGMNLKNPVLKRRINAGVNFLYFRENAVCLEGNALPHF